MNIDFTVTDTADGSSVPTPPNDRGQSPEEQWNPDIVDAYADRLGAVTHAFSLCCKVMTTQNMEYVVMTFVVGHMSTIDLL